MERASRYGGLIWRARRVPEGRATKLSASWKVIPQSRLGQRTEAAVPRAADHQGGPEVGKEEDRAHSRTFARDLLCTTVGTDLRPRANFSPCVKLEMSGSKSEVTSKTIRWKNKHVQGLAGGEGFEDRTGKGAWGVLLWGQRLSVTLRSHLS